MEEETDALEKPKLKAEKKPRSELQIAAFEAAKLKRQVNSKIRNEQIAVIKDKARKMELVSDSIVKEEPITKEEPIVIKPKEKKKRQKIVYESESSSSEEEIVVVKKKKSKLVNDLVVPYSAPVVLQSVIKFI